ncbi:putative NAD dependent epimerase/dehydratase [Glonium stellatum]|uniref:Putative NAD dependent epimerase/dehydratase n=1 Tax=Glonium stellatum TaxID=574774 RepID=A0A8E2JZ21_9PEZI|nr:putative NAD dependent epimerase/dehydratase [Glonium stellatum]
MKVFVTGATGFIGQVTVEELVCHGHQVVGLARSDSSAENIKQAGAEVHRGDIEDIESLRAGAKAADGVVHLAFIHDFSDLVRSFAIDRTAIEAMVHAMVGTGKPMVIASGTMMLSKGKLGMEDDHAEEDTIFAERAKADELLKAMSKDNDIRGISIRLPPTVHGIGDKAYVPMLVSMARKNGCAIYIGNGSQRWSAVHRKDAAVLFRLALEKGAAGATYHGVSEEGVKVKDIVDIIGKHLQLPVVSQSDKEAEQTLGFIAQVVSADNPISSEKTRKELGWEPRQPHLLPDIEANYFS